MKELNLTQGSVPKVLLQFAVPFLIANVLQALYGGADLFVVGQYDDSASVAAVAIGSQVMQTITGIILGITTGTTVLIAIATGAKDNRKVASTIGSSLVSRLLKLITSSRSWATTSGRSLNVITVFSICVLASFVRLGAKDWNDTAVNISTKGHCKIIPE